MFHWKILDGIERDSIKCYSSWSYENWLEYIDNYSIKYDWIVCFIEKYCKVLKKIKINPKFSY